MRLPTSPCNPLINSTSLCQSLRSLGPGSTGRIWEWATVRFHFFSVYFLPGRGHEGELTGRWFFVQLRWTPTRSRPRRSWARWASRTSFPLFCILEVPRDLLSLLPPTYPTPEARRSSGWVLYGWRQTAAACPAREPITGARVKSAPGVAAEPFRFFLVGRQAERGWVVWGTSLSERSGKGRACWSSSARTGT